MRDAVPGAHDVRLAVLPQHPLAAQHEEDLLVGAVIVRGGGEMPGSDLDAAQAYVAAARFTTEVVPDAFDVPDCELAAVPPVDVRRSHDGDAISRRARRAGRRVTFAARQVAGGARPRLDK
jgi:hypothetical protein